MKLFLLLLIALLSACTVYKTTGPAEPNKVRDFTPMCQGGDKTIRVEGDAAVREHLARGDSLGPCENPENGEPD
ncbi:MAG: hypothetical protein AB8B96_07615 [Lysobacterales bacterium]